MRTVLTGIAIFIGVVALLMWFYSRAQAREREVAATASAGDLHGLATVRLPRGYRALGLSGSDLSLAPAEQLMRHDQTNALIFRFDRDPSNDWGGHARDPELLNVVLLPPADRADLSQALNNFSIGRYYSPTGSTIALDDPRWRTANDDRYRWRMLAMNDHFTVGHPPRWAIAMLDQQRGVRVDVFVLQKRMKEAEAVSMVREILDSLQITPKLDEHFAQTSTVAERVDRLREANLDVLFAALAPHEVSRPALGAIAYGRDMAVLLEDDGKAVRIVRVLAAVKLANGIAGTRRDKYGRPELTLLLRPEQYPGPTIGGLPEVPLHLFYWNPSVERWQRTRLQEPTTDEDYPLTPIDDAVTAKLEAAGARDVVYLFTWRDYYQPPSLDDTRDVGEFLAEAAQWQSELLAERIVAGAVAAPKLN